MNDEGVSDLEGDDAALIMEKVVSAIQSGLAEVGDTRLITKSLMIFESMDDEGRRVMTLIPSDSTRAWDIFGMTAFAESYASDML